MNLAMTFVLRSIVGVQANLHNIRRCSNGGLVIFHEDEYILRLFDPQAMGYLYIVSSGQTLSDIQEPLS